MKYLNKIASVLCGAAFGLVLMTSCEGGELYKVGAPDWLSDKVDSIAEANKPKELEGMQEDVYTIGATDYSTGWWQQFSKYYPIPDSQTWYGVFNLNINPAATNTYKNFAMIICNDEERGAANYKEYGAIRFDNQPSGNSEWGDYIDRSLVTSSLTFETDTDEGVDKLGGKVTVTVDRSEANAFTVIMTNGTVTKTYKQSYALTNLNADPSNTNIRVFFVPEGSFINFLQSNIEPIGGFTSAEDKQPLSMELKGYPKKVLLGTELTDIVKNVTATVHFEQEVSKDVASSELSFQAVPDLFTVGKKSLVAVYNKTYKGEGAAAPVIASVEFEVVDKMYTSVGAGDNTTAFWGAHSEYVKVEPGTTYVATFTNYTAGAGNYQNFITVLTNADGSEEYGVLRADNWCWGTKFTDQQQDEHVTKVMDEGRDWATWLAAMEGAKVTVYVSNNGDGTADVKAVMVGNDQNTYTQEYKGLNTVSDANNFYVHFTVDHCHIEFDNAIGADDNSGDFWSQHSAMINVPKGKTYVTRFKNFTRGEGNYQNFIMVLTNADGSEEYAVMRADNWCWGTKFTDQQQDEHVTKVMEDGRDWATWLSAMDEAVVTASVTNKGDGTADIKFVMVGNDGKTYTQEYKGLNTISNPDDVNFHFTVDHSHLVFE